MLGAVALTAVRPRLSPRLGGRSNFQLDDCFVRAVTGLAQHQGWIPGGNRAGSGCCVVVRAVSGQWGGVLPTTAFMSLAASRKE